MTAPANKFLIWGPRRDDALRAWVARGMTLGFDMTYVRNGVQLPSDASAVEAALKRATACKCGEAPAEPTVRNPLRSMREAAGLSQTEAAARMGVTRGSWANAEKAASATAAMVARACLAFEGRTST